jgi:uncharacterized integral membrane protein
LLFRDEESRTAVGGREVYEMKPRSIIVVVLLVCAALFAILNWTAFSASTTIDLAVMQIEAPLGVIMLSFVVLLSLVYLALLARIEALALVESRKQGRELERLRKLADGAQDSRLQELANQIAVEFEFLRESLERLGAGKAQSETEGQSSE